MARSSLLVCPRCACHAKLDALQCPCGGFRVRWPAGWVAPAAVIVAMGLTVATCSDETGDDSSSTGCHQHGMCANAAGYTAAVSSSSVGGSPTSSSGDGGGGGTA